MAYYAGQQGEMAAHNIHYQFKAGEVTSRGEDAKGFEGKIKEWDTPHPAIFIPLGSHEGAAQLPTKGGTIMGYFHLLFSLSLSLYLLFVATKRKEMQKKIAHFAQFIFYKENKRHRSFLRAILERNGF